MRDEWSPNRVPPSLAAVQAAVEQMSRSLDPLRSEELARIARPLNEQIAEQIRRLVVPVRVVDTLNRQLAQRMASIEPLRGVGAALEQQFRAALPPNWQDLEKNELERVLEARRRAAWRNAARLGAAEGRLTSVARSSNA